LRAAATITPVKVRRENFLSMLTTLPCRWRKTHPETAKMRRKVAIHLCHDLPLLQSQRNLKGLWS
jgi:hypothetical protein